MRFRPRYVGIALVAALLVTPGIRHMHTDPAAPTAGAALPTALDVGPARGALAVGAAAYAVPSDAVFVSLGGNNANPGTLGAPLRTVAAGLAKARVGGTVVVRAGTYHESVLSTQTVTLENYPGEAVWLDGSSAVSGWVKSGTTWVKTGWTKEFSSLMGGDSSFKSRFVDGSYPMAADPDQVFLNGTQLTQVGSAAAATAGKFYVDDAGNRIVIGSDPTGKEIRASDLKQAITLSGNDSVLRGIGVRRYANGYEYGGAVQLRGFGGTVENVVIQDVATIGLALRWANKTVNHVTVNRAGMLGIVASLTDNSVIENSIATGNDTQGFKPEPTSGGMKFGSSRTLTVRNNEANSNGRATGIWFDVSCYDVTAVGNTANSNLKYGIEMEISSKGIIANNTTENDKEAGIILLDAEDFQVFNNDTGGANINGLKLYQDERRQADGLNLEGRDPRWYSSVDPTVTWITRNITIANNVFGNQGSYSKGSYQLTGLDGRTHSPMDAWNVTVNGNLFNAKVNSSSPTMVGWGKGDNVSLELYQTPAALAAAKNPAWVNAQVPTSERIENMEPDKTTYQSVATPLPDDVAAAIGQSAGSKRLGALLVSTVPPNQPTAAFTATPTGLSAAFDGSGSTDNGTVTSYAWDFGDGTFGVGATPTHVYQSAGTRTVTLTVTDNTGGTGTVSQDVTVAPLPNVAPTAAFSSVVTNDSVALDATGSSDSDGTIATYAWDFGDSTADTTTGATPTHTYATAGDHTVTLTVTDDEGAASDPVSHLVTTTDPPPNTPPAAAFSSAVTNNSVAFDATGSTDSDGTVSTYAWDFGDSTIDTTAGSTPTHIYATPGDHTVTLTVTDDEGATSDLVSHLVTTTDPPANQDPVPAFSFTPTGLSVAFDASTSTDDGTITSYSWNFGDGTPAVGGATRTHPYSTAGTRTVTLTVTDNLGVTKSVSHDVAVTTPSLASDTFLRTVANGWGSANVGGAWTLTGGTTLFNVGGGLGKMLLPASLTLDADLNSVNSNATLVTASFSVDKLVDGTYVGVVTRQIGTNYYTVRLRLSADGTIVMNLLLNSSTLIGSNYTVPGLKVVPGQLYTIKAEAKGTTSTTVSGKVWKTVGGTEPAAWQRTGTNTLAALQGAGHVGLFGKLPTSPPAGTVPVTLAWASFRADAE